MSGLRNFHLRADNNGSNRALRTSVRAAMEPLENRVLFTTLYWDPSGAATATGGSGMWNAATANWRSGSPTGPLVAWNNSTTNTAVFPAGGGTVSLGTTITAGALLFQDTGYQISGNTLTFGSGTSNIDVPSGDTATISSTIAGSGAVLTTTDSGTLVLSGSNIYTGGILLNAGTLAIAGNSTGSVTNGPAGTGTITLNGGTLANVSSTAYSIANKISLPASTASVIDVSGTGGLTLSGQITGSGALTVASTGSGALTLSATNNNYSGGTDVNSGQLVAGTNNAFGTNSTLTINNLSTASVNTNGKNIAFGSLSGGGASGGNINGVTGTLTIGSDNTNQTYAGSIWSGSGSGTLTKTGAGTQTFTGSSNLGASGTTNLTGGAIILSSGGTFADNNLYVSTAASGQNNLALTVSGSGTTWTNGGNVAIGEKGSGNCLTVSGGATFSAYLFWISGGPGNPTGSSSNTVTVTGPGSYLHVVGSNNWDVADRGTGSSLNILAGATAAMAGAGYLGYYSGANSNSITVSGTGSTWNIGGLNTAYSSVGSDNTITVSSGGAIIDTGGMNLGGGSGGAANTTLSIDATGTVSTRGFSMISTSTLNVGIGSSSYGVLNVQGNITLNGTLALTDPGASPANMQYQLIQSTGTTTGTFSSVTSSAGMTYASLYGATGAIGTGLDMVTGPQQMYFVTLGSSFSLGSGFTDSGTLAVTSAYVTAFTPAQAITEAISGTVTTNQGGGTILTWAYPSPTPTYPNSPVPIVIRNDQGHDTVAIVPSEMGMSLSGGTFQGYLGFNDNNNLPGNDNDYNDLLWAITAKPVPIASITATANSQENGTGGNFHVALTNANGTPWVAAADTTVSYTVGGTAIATTNYTTLSGSVTILAGSSSADVSVAALEDNHIDPTLTVDAVISAGGSAYAASTSSTTVNIFDGDTRTVTIGSPVLAAGGTADLEVDVSGLFSQADPITLSGYDSSIVSFSQTSLTWTGSSEVVHFQVSGLSAGQTSITATDAAGNHSDGTASATVVAVASITATDNGASGNTLTAYNNSGGTLDFTSNTDGSGSINLSAVVNPGIAAAYSATQYVVLETGTSTLVTSGTLASAGTGGTTVLLPSIAGGGAAAYTIEAGTYVNGTFVVTQTTGLAATA